MMADKEVQKFLNVAKRHGLPDEILKEIDSEVFKDLNYKFVIVLRRIGYYLLKAFVLLFLLICVLCLCLVIHILCSLAGVPLFDLEKWFGFGSERYLDFYGMNPYAEKCVVRMEDFIPLVNEVFRTPVKCNFCHNVRSVKRVKQLDQNVFSEKYAYSGRPIIVTDATLNWTAQKVFSYSFFKVLYERPALKQADQSKYSLGREEQEPQGSAACQFFPYKTAFRSVEEVFAMSESRALMKNGSQPWYVGWSNCDPMITNTLRQHYSRPYFLPNISESSKLDWIFMGSPGYGAQIHVDNVKYPSWQAQLRGLKRWTLKPPYECRYECPNKITALVKPGEIIVLDTNIWYHATIIEGDYMSITIGSEFD